MQYCFLLLPKIDPLLGTRKPFTTPRPKKGASKTDGRQIESDEMTAVLMFFVLQAGMV